MQKEVDLENLVWFVAKIVEDAEANRPKRPPVKRRRRVAIPAHCVAVEAEPATSLFTSVVQGMGFLHQGTKRAA